MFAVNYFDSAKASVPVGYDFVGFVGVVDMVVVSTI